MDEEVSIQRPRANVGVSDIIAGAAIAATAFLIWGRKDMWTQPEQTMAMVMGIIYLWSCVGILAMAVKLNRVVAAHTLSSEEATKFMNPVLCPAMFGCLFTLTIGFARPGPAPHTELFWAFVIMIGVGSFLLFGAGMFVHDLLAKQVPIPETAAEPEKAP